MTSTHQELWDNCLAIIKDNVNGQSFKTWFEPIVPVRLEGKILTIQVPSLFFFEWLEEHYVSLLKKTIKKEMGPGAKLEYNIIVENSSGGTKPHTIKIPTQRNKHDEDLEISVPSNGSSIKNPFIIPGIKKVNVDSQLNASYNFSNFIEGDCNRLARSAGQAVAARPGGTSFNPLFIYGGVGLGKTHLAQAIGNQVKENLKNKTVLYITSEKFTSQFVESIKNNSINDFVNFYQLIDLLIVDDVQFFANKDKTQDIFFHIFNHLQQNGKQLVLTSDRPPKDLAGLEERLLSRFKWGLSADIQIPDYETRYAIMEHKMYADGIELSKDVIEYVAYTMTGNVRELEGALISLLAHSSLTRKDIDLQLAKDILKNFVKQSTKELTIEHIQKLISDHFEMPVDLLKSKTRKRHIVQARQISMYFAKNFTRSSLSNIGKHFGGRDHSTVIHACQTVQDLMQTDSRFKNKVIELEKLINVNFK
jgi:chromosomal replication initiator protein